MVKFLGGLGDNRVKNVETPTFLPEDNIRFGVEYSPDSRPPVIGRNHTIYGIADRMFCRRNGEI